MQCLAGYSQLEPSWPEIVGLVVYIFWKPHSKVHWLLEHHGCQTWKKKECQASFGHVLFLIQMLNAMHLQRSVLTKETLVQENSSMHDQCLNSKRTDGVGYMNGETQGLHWWDNQRNKYKIPKT